jgi:tRNA(Arg) A34 adenosine deaminase TadA
MFEKIAIAKKAAELAFSAMQKGTYGVGGLLVDNKTLEIVHTQENAVIVDGILTDSTAHVKRQTVDWYFRRQAENSNLPDPKDLTIVSSLDPCMMCAGSILASGFNVVSLSMDKFGGVVGNGPTMFETLPVDLAQRARETFSYFGIQGSREYIGYSNDVFNNIELPVETAQMSDLAFSQSLAKAGEVRQQGQSSEISCDIKELEAKCVKYGVLSTSEKSKELEPLLIQTAGGLRQDDYNCDSAVLILPNGEKLMARSSQFDMSPIMTPVFRLVRDYVGLQKTLKIENKGELPHIQHCQIVMLHGFGRQAHDIATIAAYASTLQNDAPDTNKNPLTFLNARQSQKSLAEMLSRFPPIYGVGKKLMVPTKRM